MGFIRRLSITPLNVHREKSSSAKYAESEACDERFHTERGLVESQ